MALYSCKFWYRFCAVGALFLSIFIIFMQILNDFCLYLVNIRSAVSANFLFSS